MYQYNDYVTGMDLDVKHVKQKDLPLYVFPDAMRLVDLSSNRPVRQPATAAMGAPASVAGNPPPSSPFNVCAYVASWAI